MRRIRERRRRIRALRLRDRPWPMNHPNVIVRVHSHRRHVAEHFSRRQLRERRIDFEARRFALRQSRNDRGQKPTNERKRQQNLLHGLKSFLWFSSVSVVQFNWSIGRNVRTNRPPTADKKAVFRNHHAGFGSKRCSPGTRIQRVLVVKPMGYPTQSSRVWCRRPDHRSWLRNAVSFCLAA